MIFDGIMALCYYTECVKF